MCKKKPTMIHSQCDTHPQFESQLKLVHNLNTVKQTTTEILMEETNPVKQTPHKVSNTNKPWLTTSSNTSYDHHSARPPAREPSTYWIRETPITYQYSVPIANRYTTLSSCQEQQPTSEITSPPRPMTVKNRKYAKRSPKRKKVTYHQRPIRTSPPNKHNLQERRGNDDDDSEINYIPTIINGITDMTQMSQLNSRNKVSVYNLLSELEKP